jgi:hypothetical protein
LRRRDMDVAVTQPSQHRDYLPDIGSPSGRAGYGKAARPDRESESRMAELFDRDRLGRAAVNARGAAMATGSFVKVARCRRAIPNTTQCAPGRYLGHSAAYDTREGIMRRLTVRIRAAEFSATITATGEWLDANRYKPH